MVRLLQLCSVVVEQPAWVPGVASVHQSPSSSSLHLLTTHHICITGMKAKVPVGGFTSVTHLTFVCVCVNVCVCVCVCVRVWVGCACMHVCALSLLVSVSWDGLVLVGCSVLKLRLLHRILSHQAGVRHFSLVS